MAHPKDEVMARWIAIGLNLVTTVVPCVAFLYGLHLRVTFLETAIQESSKDRHALHEEIRTLDETKFMLRQCQNDLSAIDTRLANHERKEDL
jgi:hypothetical protein